MAFPELACVGRPRERPRSMPTTPYYNDPEYWRERAEEARVLAELMMDKTAKEAMLRVAEDCDARLIDETKGS